MIELMMFYAHGVRAAIECGVHNWRNLAIRHRVLHIMHTCCVYVERNTSLSCVLAQSCCTDGCDCHRQYKRALDASTSTYVTVNARGALCTGKRYSRAVVRKWRRTAISADTRCRTAVSEAKALLMGI